MATRLIPTLFDDPMGGGGATVNPTAAGTLPTTSVAGVKGKPKGAKKGGKGRKVSVFQAAGTRRKRSLFSAARTR